MAAYESAKDQQGVIDFEDVLLLLAAMLGRAAATSPSRSGSSTSTSSSTSTRTSARSSSTCSTSGWAAGRSCASSATRARPSTRSPARPPTTSRRSPGRYPRATTVELVRDYRSTPQVVSLANHVMHASRKAGGPAPLELRAQRPDGPDVSYATYPDDDAEAAGVTDAIATLVRAGCPRRRDRGALPDQRAVGGVRGGAGGPGIAYQVRGNARFFARADVRKAMVLLRGGARAADPGTPMPESVRDILRSAGWTDDAAGGQGSEPRALGRAPGARLARRRPRRGAPDGRRAADRLRPRRRARRARRRAARARPSRA